ncbi:histone-lysine N-methyltransferase ATXR3-like protein [Perilla frutescens var. hirtella]|uniref:Histone-lysine N-methyltransferase ATXR3-like protein n=1 Tax=Perilla frutescens var. hirtella TaxID=608512 RepID=A0AAD4P3E2_PERFH|nr:histone-lysine N-methyltransferase ATXR3-like protein [Perilla frutescens var. hirtella]
MASINFNPFGDNWFKFPPKLPMPPIHLVSSLFKPQAKTPNFAAIPNPFSKKQKPEPDEKPGKYTQMVEQFYWECENMPDYRHSPEVEKILQEDPLVEKKENPTREEIEENKKWWAEFRSSPVVQFLARAEEIAGKLNEMELQENSIPYKKEDKKLWQAVPNVIGLDGRPMPRKAIKTKRESDDKFWDFARQFFFGLWGFRQQPYPPGRPIDVAIGYKALERCYHDFIMKTGGWYYKDRLGRTRGPMELIQLKTAWGAGIIDKHTFIWGDDLDEWAPISMIHGMERAIATWEACIHKLQKGIPPWVSLKGHEDKTYKQLQEEAYESKRRDLAVLEANDGVWPGVSTPSHALFLWAGGSELTIILEEDHMPKKFIPKDVRQELAKIIPGLRPWEVLSIEQAMDHITFGGKWYREPLGSFTTGPPYIAEWNKDVLRLFEIFHNLSVQTYNKLEKAIPGFDEIMVKVQAEAEKKAERRKAKREAEKKANEERKALAENSL